VFKVFSAIYLQSLTIDRKLHFETLVDLSNYYARKNIPSDFDIISKLLAWRRHIYPLTFTLRLPCS